MRDVRNRDRHLQDEQLCLAEAIRDERGVKRLLYLGCLLLLIGSIRGCSQELSACLVSRPHEPTFRSHL